MSQWCYADVWEAVAAGQPGRAAVIQGDQVLSWGAFNAAADSLAAAFVAAGAGPQAKVGCYLHNGAEYLIVCAAAFKAGMVPFNVNYRYGPAELTYLFDNADAEIVVFDAAYTEKVEAVRPRLPGVKAWISVGEDAPAFAEDFEALIARPAPARFQAPWGRSGHDEMFIYTGGTTGMPKGVMWRQEDLFAASRYYENEALGIPPLRRPEEAASRAAAYGQGVLLIASPLMHATALISAFTGFSGGDALVLLPSRRFNPAELLDEIERCGVTRFVGVGMPFFTPILETLDAHPGRWPGKSLRAIGSSGAMWSYENKQGLLRHWPHISLSDSYGASEAFGMGQSISTAGGEVKTAKFTIGEDVALFTEEGRRVTPGSNERGRIALAGPMPQGYYKDPDKTARTFPTLEGRRWSMPGDWATVDEDGTLNVLGRGSQCINTGGEKVFPEEVEEALKRHAAIRDAGVVGLPDERFGETITALVELVAGAEAPGVDELKAWVRSQLADYKAPRRVLVVDSVGRSPNGKLDYGMLKTRAAEGLTGG